MIIFPLFLQKPLYPNYLLKTGMLYLMQKARLKIYPALCERLPAKNEPR
jgi:hypothetical protein